MSRRALGTSAKSLWPLYRKFRFHETKRVGKRDRRIFQTGSNFYKWIHYEAQKIWKLFSSYETHEGRRKSSFSKGNAESSTGKYSVRSCHVFKQIVCQSEKCYWLAFAIKSAKMMVCVLNTGGKEESRTTAVQRNVNVRPTQSWLFWKIVKYVGLSKHLDSYMLLVSATELVTAEDTQKIYVDGLPKSGTRLFSALVRYDRSFNKRWKTPLYSFLSRNTRTVYVREMD